ncbi:MAG: hypothetical protein GWP18_04840 [Proteobacteria bacterium]|nr:hypothetical protein [Pseudomonadota bacterium]
MARLSRFEEHRFVGTRDDMRVYDCDDDDQFLELSERIAEERLVEAKILQTFAPDSISDARNRGFRPF